VEIRAFGYAMEPMQVFPAGRCLRHRRGTADFPTTTSGAAHTSPPERVFRPIIRYILRKEYRRAVGTHYGPTRRHQAGYSPRHRRDCIAGTTILYHLRIYRWVQSLSVMTTCQQGLLEYRHRRRTRLGRRTFQGLRAGRSSGRRRRIRPVRAAVPFGDYCQSTGRT
jgi:hypothetical protein